MSQDWNLLFEIQRAGITERAITGAVALWENDRALTFGDPQIFGRSLMKPFQMKAVAPVLESVFDWEQKALSLASHSGTAEHLAVLKRMESGSQSVLKSSHPCSGKHAAILKVCDLKKWPKDQYTDASHPYNVDFRKGLEARLGVSFADRIVAPDGCGLPTFAMTVAEIAKLFATLADEREADWIWEAHHRHPDLIGGSGRLDSRILTAHPDLLAKEGADGLLGISVATGGRKAGAVVKLAQGYDVSLLETAARPLLQALGFPLESTAAYSGQTVRFTPEYEAFLAEI